MINKIRDLKTSMFVKERKWESSSSSCPSDHRIIKDIREILKLLGQWIHSTKNVLNFCELAKTPYNL